MGPPPSKTTRTCVNPSCKHFNVFNPSRTLHKCSRCQTAHYCDKECQKAHWRQHKELCAIWAEAAKQNGELPVHQIKKKMVEFIWLLRGVIDYCEDLHDEWLHWKRKGQKGSIEFFFDGPEPLFEAVRIIQALPVVERIPFYPIPFAPTYTEEPDGTPIAQKLPLRDITDELEVSFQTVIDKRMVFRDKRSTDTQRPNMENLFKLLGNNENMFIISVSVLIKPDQSTHMYDIFYKRVSWFPEDGPNPEEIGKRND